MSIVRNPSPEDLDKLKNEHDVVAESSVPNKVIDNNKIVNLRDLDSLPVKTDSIFSPEKHKYKLILPRNYYKDLQHINEDNTILIRRMTAIEEGFFYDMLKEQKIDLLIFFDVINKALSECVRTNIDFYKLNIIEKVPLFIKILSLTYGNTHEFKFKCNECGNKYQVSINLDEDLDVIYAEQETEIPFKIKLETYKAFDVFLYVSTPIMKHETSYLNSSNSWFEKLKLLTYKIEGVINNKVITEDDYDEILSNLNSTDIKKIKEINQKFTVEYGMNLSDINIQLCNNMDCSLYKKTQQLALPLDVIFFTMFNDEK